MESKAESYYSEAYLRTNRILTAWAGRTASAIDPETRDFVIVANDQYSFNGNELKPVPVEILNERQGCNSFYVATRLLMDYRNAQEKE